MSEGQIYLFSGFLAAIPALLWLSFFIHKTKKVKSQIFVFIAGIFSVIPVILINILLYSNPEINFIKHIDETYQNIHIHFLITLGWVSVVEEIIKQWVVRITDKKKLIIETINDSIRFSLITALGFSFAENLFYMYQIFIETDIKTFIAAFMYRSIFTTMGHLVFSGYFGYYYGLSKFSVILFEQKNLMGEKNNMFSFIAKILKISKIQAYKEFLIIKGLLIAIILHTAYNYFLSALNSVLLSTILIATAFFYLLYLFKNRAGNLILLKEKNLNSSSMARSDQDVVMELIAMWTKEKKYVDVIYVCERLLKRDPQNKVVQLFKAKALDKISPDNQYGVILKKLFPSKDESIIVKKIKSQIY